MADQDGRHSKMIMQLLHHVTSSPQDADDKRDILKYAIYPPILVVIAFCIVGGTELVGVVRGVGGGGGGVSVSTFHTCFFVLLFFF